MAKLKHVIVGNGPAGMTAAQTIRSLSNDDEITLITEERYHSYSRILLPDYVSGRVPLEKLWLRSESYYEEARIDVRLGTKAVSVQPEDNLLETGGGEKIYFDKLLIAPGGKPKLPPIEGISKANVLSLNDIADAQNIIAVVGKGAEVIVLAHDLIGIELTRAFSQMGTRVTYVEIDDALLPHILDLAAAEELTAKMEAAGIEMVIGEGILKIEGSHSGVSVHTSARRIEADALAVAIGRAPKLDWLESSGIMTDSGVIADERLRTNHPNIYVAGDAAEIFDPRTEKRKLLFGWKNALEQGAIAGANMGGDMKEFIVTYKPGIKQIFGVDIRHRWK